MKKSIGALKYPHAFSVAAALLAAFGSACQTSPLVVADRIPAQSDPPDAKTAALLERDGLEAIGIIAHGALLDHKLERHRLKGALVKVEDRGFKPDVSSVLFTTLGINLAASGLTSAIWASLTNENSSDGSAGSSSVKQTQFITKLFRGNTSLAVVGVGVAGGSLSYSLVFGTIAATDKFDNHTDSEDLVAPLQVVIRRKAYKSWREARADYENRTITFADPTKPETIVKNQAAFEASLKKLAKDLSDRTTLLLHLEESEQTALRVHIESRLRDAFGSDATFRNGADFKLDIRKLLRGITNDIDERQEAVEQLIKATKMRPEPLAASEVRKALEDLIGQVTEVNKNALIKYEELARSTDPAMKAMSSEYYAFSRDLESYRRKIKTQIALLPPAPKK